MAGGGYIWLHRSIRDNWIYKDAEYLKVWLEILLVAKFSHVPKTEIYEGVTYTLSYGQFVFGRPSWSKRLGITEDRLKLLFKKLCNEDMIRVVRKTNRFTIYFVTNFTQHNTQQQSHEGEQFSQCDPQQNPQRIPSRYPADTQQIPNNKNGNNGNNVKNVTYLRQAETSKIISTYQNYTGDHNINRQKDLLAYQDKLDEDVIIEAIRDSLMGDRPDYLFGILERCVKQKLTTLHQYIDDKKRHVQQQKIRQAQQAQKTPQHEIFDKRDQSDTNWNQYYTNIAYKEE